MHKSYILRTDVTYICSINLIKNTYMSLIIVDEIKRIFLFFIEKKKKESMK
jgi:hypothetical protein